MSDQIQNAVSEVVNDAVDEAVETVREEHAVETAAERVEDAAERVEAAAAHTDAAHDAPPLTAGDIHSIIAEHVGPLHDRLSALETPAPDAQELAETTAEETVAEIAAEVEERAQDAEGEIEGGDLPDGGEIVGEPVAPETVAEVVDADIPPRKTHFMHRSIFGR